MKTTKGGNIVELPDKNQIISDFKSEADELRRALESIVYAKNSKEVKKAIEEAKDILNPPPNKQEDSLKKVTWKWKGNINQNFDGDEKCLHNGCSQCHGTGIKKNGEICVHMISCPCKNCNPFRW